MKILFETEKDNCLNLAETTASTNTNVEITTVETNFGTQIDRQKYINGNFMKNITKILLILILANINLFAEFKNGDGSAQNPYEIWTLEDLIKVSDFPDKHFIQKANIRKPLTYPLCTEKPFTGSYNGNGYLINLAIDCGECMDCALFSLVAGNAVLKNIVTKGFVKNGIYRVAGIVAVFESDGAGEISGCVNTANLNGLGVSGIAFITTNNVLIERNINIGNLISDTITIPYVGNLACGIISSTGFLLEEPEEQKIINNLNAGLTKVLIFYDDKRNNNACGISNNEGRPWLIRISNNLNTGVVREPTKSKTYGIGPKR